MFRARCAETVHAHFWEECDLGDVSRFCVSTSMVILLHFPH